MDYSIDEKNKISDAETEKKKPSLQTDGSLPQFRGKSEVRTVSEVKRRQILWYVVAALRTS
jgi:hypothetical protein